MFYMFNTIIEIVFLKHGLMIHIDYEINMNKCAEKTQIHVHAIQKKKHN